MLIAIIQYLSDLSCPLPASTPIGAVVFWLVSHALSLEYADNGKPMHVSVCTLSVLH